MKVQLLMSKFLSMLGAGQNQVVQNTTSGGSNTTTTGTVVDGIDYGDTPQWIIDFIAPVIRILNTLLIPVIILLGTAGTIYAIVLGVQYAKAETADKRDECKKRLINAVIGIVIMLVALVLLKIFTANANEIFGWVDLESKKTNTNA